MNERERFVGNLTFRKVDRVPLEPGYGRKSTRENWHRQGLPADMPPHRITAYAYAQAGGTLELPTGGPSPAVDERMIPQFEEKVIERRENSQVVQDWKGNICEIGNEFTIEYLRNAVDFVTRRWIKCPVESRADWEEMKRRYDHADPARTAEVKKLAPQLAGRSHPVVLRFSGPFWQLREWLGFENLCTAFYDDPVLVRDMILFWEAHVAGLLREALRHTTPDMVHLSEDMAYKSFSMISPALVREFLLPTWKRWGDIVRGAGVPLYAMDSDGYIGELIPLWIEAGINCCDPIEVAAGNDIVQFRKTFGTDMSYRGGVDKRLIAKGGAAIEGEIRRLRPVIESGGFIPGCDHGVPSDVSWPDFVRYTGLLAKATGWM